MNESATRRLRLSPVRFYGLRRRGSAGGRVPGIRPSTGLLPIRLPGFGLPPLGAILLAILSLPAAALAQQAANVRLHGGQG